MGRLLGQSMGAAFVAIVFGLVHGNQTAWVAWCAAILALTAAGASSLRVAAVGRSIAA
jgi:DHA2 family multidrug resistance protein-like MFS transporter